MRVEKKVPKKSSVAKLHDMRVKSVVKSFVSEVDGWIYYADDRSNEEISSP